MDSISFLLHSHIDKILIMKLSTSKFFLLTTMMVMALARDQGYGTSPGIVASASIEATCGLQGSSKRIACTWLALRIHLFGLDESLSPFF